MRHLTLVAVAASFIVAGILPAPAGTATPEVALTIAKTQKRIYAYGTASPGRSDRRVRVIFTHVADGGSERVVAKLDRLSEPDGGASRFGVSFPRPTSGSCKVRVRYRVNYQKAIDEHSFACSIPDFGTGTATIMTTAGAVEFDIQIADEGDEMGYGLMYRRWLAPDKGMAFLFGSDTQGSFYMKNTLIPLSIAFWDSAGRIIEILDMEPCPEDPCPLYGPDQPYRGALEVNKGAFADRGVAEGDFITITED